LLYQIQATGGETTSDTQAKAGVAVGGETNTQAKVGVAVSIQATKDNKKS
jgi:hypothetical protein